MGDGKKRLDYLPTSRKRINDGEWHTFELIFNYEKETVRFFVDDKPVAIYNYRELEVGPTIIERPLRVSESEALEIKKVKTDVKWAYKVKVKSSQDTFQVVNWNIWHGGRHNGVPAGIEQTIQHIRERNPDIVCLQETYGSGPIIADSLDMHFFLISSNLSILTRFPVVEVFLPWDDFRFGGAVLQTGPDQYIAVFDVWLNYLPDTDQQIKGEYGYGEILEEEMRLRGREALDMMKAFKQLGLICPVIMTGDMNSGSHLDWTLENSFMYGGYFLPWPVSKTFAREGFTDSYRAIYPDSGEDLGFTWSPRFPDVLQYRIDYIYHDRFWQTIAAGVDGYGLPSWSSDHALTWATLVLQKPARP